MKRSLLTSALAAAIAVSALATTAVSAETFRMLRVPQLSTNMPALRPFYRGPILQLAMMFRCDVRGTPAEFPNDLTIWPINNYAIPAGTLVRWTVPSTMETGMIVTPHLAPGQSMFLSNVLTHSLPATTACTAAES